MLRAQDIKITPAILRRISDIDEFKGRWNALSQYTTALQMLGDYADFGHNFRVLVKGLHKQPFDQDIMQKLHIAFKLNEDAPGEFRTEDFPLVVQKGHRMIGSLDSAAPREINELVTAISGWLNKSLEDDSNHPLITIGIFIALILQVAPFKKGNQRLSRVLLMMLMIKEGYDYAPFASIEMVFQNHAQEYFEALQYTHQTIENGEPDFTQWLEVFLAILADHKNNLAKRMVTKTKAVAGLPPLSSKIMKLFEKQKSWTMREMIKATKAKRSTLKLRLGELVKAGYLKRHGQGAGVRYSLI